MNTPAHSCFTQQRIPATYMRGGTSKGVFFRLQDLPAACQQPGTARDQLLLRVLGSPDPYGKQIDGMGGASSSTSKAVIIGASQQPNHDVDYLFGQVSIDQAFIDWSGNCGNLSSAVGGFAIANGFIPTDRIPENGVCTVRVWQANIQKTILAHIPIHQGQVQETGHFELDGVTFPAAEIQLDFIDPADTSNQGGLFPTDSLVNRLNIPGYAPIEATLINAGIPIVFIKAQDVGCSGCELQQDINNNPSLLAHFEAIRVQGALAMGLIQNPEEAKTRQHTPKIAFVAPPKTYTSSSGKEIQADHIHLLVRALSMGKLHHAMMGTAAVAIATAANIPGTLVHQAIQNSAHAVNALNTSNQIVFGHPSGTLKTGAQTSKKNNEWIVQQVSMSRSARTLMEGWVRIPL